MGLDMYLRGHKFTPTGTDIHKRPIVDGYEVESINLDLGYWRKHWALHTYIEDHYLVSDGWGGDKIDLTADDLREIAEAIEMEHLPQSSNVFQLQPDQIAKTIKTFKDAAAWMDRDDGFWRNVTYYGSC